LADTDDVESENISYTRNKPKRKPLPKDLPREVVVMISRMKKKFVMAAKVSCWAHARRKFTDAKRNCLAIGVFYKTVTEDTYYRGIGKTYASLPGRARGLPNIN
jgi:hypothetical protein